MDGVVQEEGLREQPGRGQRLRSPGAFVLKTPRKENVLRQRNC